MKKTTAFFAMIITVALLFSSCTFANKAGRDTPQIKDEWIKYADGNSECAQTYKTLIAFFTKDTAALASAAGVEKDLLKNFDSIEFSSYDIPYRILEGKRRLASVLRFPKATVRRFPAVTMNMRSRASVQPFMRTFLSGKGAMKILRIQARIVQRLRTVCVVICCPVLTAKAVMKA